MEFSLFAHMERLQPEQDHAALYEDFVSLCTMADEGGMRAIWTGEHHGMEFTIAPNPFITITDVARHTKNVRLGTGTIVVPFWHPIKLAGEAAMLDVISNGRLEFGIARGAYQYEFDRLVPGMKASEGGAALREMVPAIKALWQGDYAHEGEVYQFPTSTCVPKPQQSMPPMWIAARDPSSHEFAVANGCNVMVTALMKGDEEVADLADKFDTACAKHPEVPRPELMLLRHTYVHEEDDPEGWKVGAEGLNRFYRHFLGWFKNESPVTDGYMPPVSPESVADNPEFTLESLHRNMMVGTPDALTERLRYYESLGITEYSYWTDNTLSFEEKKRSLERFIRDVMPRFAA